MSRTPKESVLTTPGLTLFSTSDLSSKVNKSSLLVSSIQFIGGFLQDKPRTASPLCNSQSTIASTSHRGLPRPFRSSFTGSSTCTFSMPTPGPPRAPSDQIHPRFVPVFTASDPHRPCCRSSSLYPSELRVAMIFGRHYRRCLHDSFSVRGSCCPPRPETSLNSESHDSHLPRRSIPSPMLNGLRQSV